MTTMDMLDTIAKEHFEPLCPETARIFKKLPFSSSDRLDVRLDEDGTRFIVTAYNLREDGTRGRHPTHLAASTWTTQLPEKRKGPDGWGSWVLAGTDFNALILRQVWGEERLTFSPDARILYTYLLSRLLNQTVAARARAAWAINKEVGTFSLLDHPERPLAPYQRVALKGCIGQECSALFMEQGTGKTPVVISRICNESLSFDEHGSVVFASKRQELETTAEQRATAEANRIREEAAERAAQFERALLNRCAKQMTRLRNQLKARLATALADVTEATIGDRHEEQNRYSADAMIEDAIREKGIAAREKAYDTAKAFADKSKAEAEKLAEAVREDLLAKAREDAEEFRPPETEEKRMYRVLIVCPKNVRTNWRNEFFRFATVPGKVAVLRGGQLERMKLLVESFRNENGYKWTAVIASYESVLRTWSALKMIEWDLCALDESHYIKSTSTKRYKKMTELRTLCKQRMCLTGTPITNSLFDIYAQFEFMGEGLSGFSNFKNFRKYYGEWAKAQHGDLLTGYKNVPMLQERLSRLAFMIRKDEALPDLPKKLQNIVEVEMTQAQQELYLRVQKELAVEIEADMASNRPKQLLVTNVLTKLLRLAQITSGHIVWDPVYTDDGEEVEARLVEALTPNPKLEACVELLKQAGPNDKTIVWACWVQDIKALSAALDKENIQYVTYFGATSDKDRDEAELRFNTDPACKVFIGNPAAGGTGLNLRGYDQDNAETDENNCTHVIYFSQNWSMTARSQSEDRSHRRGTRVPVTYTDLCVPGSIDEEIRARVLEKRISAYELQDVSSIMERVLNTIPEMDS